jgi:S1-C subfamily serine protease
MHVDSVGPVLIALLVALTPACSGKSHHEVAPSTTVASSPLATSPTARARGFLGLGLDGTPHGVLVANVLAGSPAAGAGFDTGDHIDSIDGTLVTSLPEMNNLLKPRHPGDAVHIVWTDPLDHKHAAEVRLAAE